LNFFLLLVVATKKYLRLKGLNKFAPEELIE